ncbi:DNA repair protein RadA [soil metagenome]
MARFHSTYVCQQCGYESTGWLGKCPNCGKWGTLVEEVTESSSSSNKSSSSKPSNFITSKPVLLSSIQSGNLPRVSTKIEELDRALGGGIVSGQVILIAGIPGIGKSTLLLQLANNLKNVVYASGEESANQIAIRAARLGVKNKNLQIIEGTDIDSIIESVSQMENLDLLIIDSIQTMSTTDLSGMAGSVGQVRESAFRLVRLAKSQNIPIFIVGHVTKEGTVAGPSVLAHIVDTVLWFEGDKSLTLRMIKATKNRFGPSDEVGVFEMKDIGLVSLLNPEKLFLSDATDAPGRITSAIMQGTRPILIEVESLVVPSKLPFPKRVASGIDAKRFELLIAVMTRRVNIPLYDYDCFINVAGGITAKDPSVDLAICLSLASSYFDKTIPKNILAIGEVGLLGDIRAVVGSERITKLSSKLGYKELEKNKSLSMVIHKFFKN